MSVKQTNTELFGHLKEQIEFLQRSAQAFDEGFTSEAKRLATTLRVLLHDTTASSSLLMLLGKKKIQFYNTNKKNSNKNQIQPTGFLQLKLSVINGKSEASYHAPLDDRPPSINANKKTDFLSWWNEKIIEDEQGNKFSRKDLVLFVSNKDGGAHIDPNLSDAYAALSRFNSLGWKASDSDGQNRDLQGLELVCVRQICHEVLKSLKDEFPQFF
jgi:hypothetical protein